MEEEEKEKRNDKEEREKGREGNRKRTKTIKNNKSKENKKESNNIKKNSKEKQAEEEVMEEQEGEVVCASVQVHRVMVYGAIGRVCDANDVPRVTGSVMAAAGLSRPSNAQVIGPVI